MCVALFAAATVEVANFALLPTLDSQLSARQLAREILKTDPSGGNVSEYHLPRNAKYGMEFYLDRELPEWVPGSGNPEWILVDRPLPGTVLGSRYEIYLDKSRAFIIYHRI